MESIVSFATILITPFLSTYGFVDNTLFRLFLVLFVVYAIRLGHISGLLAFLAAYSLLIERNHELLTLFPNQRPLPLPLPLASGGSPKQAPPLTGVHHKIPFDTPHTSENHDMELQGPMKQYEKAEDLHDNIPRIDEAPRTDAAPDFYKTKGLL